MSDVSVPVSDRKAVGKRIRSLILPGESLKAFAKRVGASESGIKKWLSGAAQPGMKSLRKIADAGDVRLDWLATGEEPMKRGASVTISERAGGTASGGKTSEGGLPMPEPHAGFDPRAVELLDRSVLVAMLTRYFELLDSKRLNWTPEQRAKRFLLIYERCMRSGNVDESLISEAIDMLT